MANDPAGKSSKSQAPPPAGDVGAAPTGTPATDAAGTVAAREPTKPSSPPAASKKKAVASAKATAKSTTSGAVAANLAPLAETPVGSAAAPGDSVAAAVTPVGTPGAQPVTLAVGQPIETTTAALQVGGLTKPGIYTFSLTVEDDLGVVSKPATITVTVPGR